MLFTSTLYQIAIIHLHRLELERERADIVLGLHQFQRTFIIVFIYLGVLLFGFKIERTYMGLFIVTIFHVVKV